MSALLRRGTSSSSSSFLRHQILLLSSKTKCLPPSISIPRSSYSAATTTGNDGLALDEASIVTSSETLGFPSQKKGRKKAAKDDLDASKLGTTGVLDKSNLKSNRDVIDTKELQVADGENDKEETRKVLFEAVKEEPEYSIEKATDPSSSPSCRTDNVYSSYFAAKEQAEWPKPSTIAWKQNISNLVNLIGCVGVPVQVESFGGKSYAVTIIQQEKSSNTPKFWVPIVFEGDLAEIAAANLKENDVIYVSGRLSVDPPQITVGNSEASIQVMASHLNFVGKSSQVNNSDSLDKYIPHAPSPGKTHRPHSKGGLWNDLFLHPKNWYDYRNEKKNPKYPDFRHKETGEVLWVIDPTTPPSVLSRLENPAFFGERSGFQPGQAADSEKSRALWHDLLTNPQNWWDKREKKISSKHPDFKHKESKEALWIGQSTPPNVLVALESPDFSKRMKGNTKWNVLWDDLLANPHNWLDNREKKVSPRHPDFVHKESKQALWIGNLTPPAVLLALENSDFFKQSGS